MTLKLVRLPVDVASLARAAADRGWSRGRHAVFDEGTALHHLLGETFGPRALQPFRLAVAPRAHRGTLYAYTMADPEELRELAAATAMPEVERALSPQRLECKVMPNAWKPGRKLGFDVRVQPTVRLSSDRAPPSDGAKSHQHGFKRGAEIDAFLAEALRHDDRNTMETSERTREQIYTEWLSKRLGDSVLLERTRMSAYRRRPVVRNGKVREMPDVVFHGTLQISAPDAFESLLTNGIGRHKAYGYGMLLLRPPGADR